ncbi:TPA: hypothetical protein MEB04_004312 [Klebsiella pneumoniae]|nr:hypothetical protein [Klebsiella pneumoniae]HBW2199415.1 hypothetical protein [Klebsiella pneumoniae]
MYVFPAPAGINRHSRRPCNALSGVPRASGDKPLAIINEPLGKECSPRQRG